MADLNKVFLMGRLTQDPELRYTPSGSAVTDLRLATSRSWTGKDGERKEESLFIDVTVWERQAENCCQYLKKGRAVHVEGYLKTESWDDKNTGEKRSKHKIIAERVQFLDRREEGAGGGGGGGGGSSYSQDDAEAPAPAPRRQFNNGGANGPSRTPSAPPRRPTPPPDHEADDDIPF